MKDTIICENEEATIKAGQDLAKQLKPQDVVFLHGNLGSGKTTFTKGVATGLGVKSRVISPTFVVVRIHHVSSQKPEVRGQQIETLYHLDLYRLENEKQAKEIDLKEFLADETGVVVIEWPDLGQNIVKKKVWKVSLEEIGIDGRKIEISYE